jgi:hypothetical protein
MAAPSHHRLMAYSSAATSIPRDIDQFETFLARGTGEPLIERYELERGRTALCCDESSRKL